MSERGVGFRIEDRMDHRRAKTYKTLAVSVDGEIEREMNFPRDFSTEDIATFLQEEAEEQLKFALTSPRAMEERDLLLKLREKILGT